MKQASRAEERLNSALIHYFVKCASGYCIPEPCLVVYGIFLIEFHDACYGTSEKTINPMLRPFMVWLFIVLTNPRQREFLPLDPEQMLCPCNPAEFVATLHSQQWAYASPLTLQSGECPPIPQYSEFGASSLSYLVEHQPNIITIHFCLVYIGDVVALLSGIDSNLLSAQIVILGRGGKIAFFAIAPSISYQPIQWKV